MKSKIMTMITNGKKGISYRQTFTLSFLTVLKVFERVQVTKSMQI